MRVVIITDDQGLQAQQLMRVFKWYNAQSNALETKEGALAIKMKEEMQEKKREMQKMMQEQKQKTLFPPIKGSKSQNKQHGTALNDKMNKNQSFLDKTKEGNKSFVVSRNTINNQNISDGSPSPRRELQQTDSASSPIKTQGNGSASPDKAPSRSVTKLLNNLTGGGEVRIIDSLYDSNLTPEQEEELKQLLSKMQLKDKHYSNHFNTVKQACFNWGKQNSKLSQLAREVYERASYGSQFHNLGVSTNKSFTAGQSQKRSKISQVYMMTENQFLNDPTSSDNCDDEEEELKQIQAQNNQKKLQEQQKHHKHNSSYMNRSGGGSSRHSSNSNNDRSSRNHLSQHTPIKPPPPVQNKQASKSQLDTTVKSSNKPGKILDLSYEDYEHKMKNVGITQDYGEHFVLKHLQDQAKNSLNIARVKDELQKEHSRRKIDKVRWLNNSIIYGSILNQEEGDDESKEKKETFGNEDNLDNAVKNGGDVMTLSLFYRPKKSGQQEFYASEGNPQYQSTEGFKQLSMTSAKGLFSKKQSLLNQLKLGEAQAEAEKNKKPSSPPKQKKEQKKAPPKKKGGKGGDEQEDEEDKPPKEKTRDDYRILQELIRASKNEKYDFFLQQMQEVQELKLFLAKSKVNVSAETLKKAILLPEEHEKADCTRQYPKIGELLFQNPFPKKKKEKKGKKKKKK